jgi:putative Mn2+ efflux pump MntP
MEEPKKWHQEAVPWATFIIIVGLGVGAITTAFTQVGDIRELVRQEAITRANSDTQLNQTSAEIKTALAGIQADLKNLDIRLSELKVDIKSLK